MKHPFYQALRVVHALGFKKTFYRLLDKHYPIVYETQEFSNMLDVRVTEIATGKVSNWFDMSTAEITGLAKALHPELYTIETWHPLLSDGPVHPDEFQGSVVAEGKIEGTIAPGETVSVYLGAVDPADRDRFDDEGEVDGCAACFEPERYDDHMHGSC